MKSAVKTSPVDMAQRRALGLRSGDTVRVWQNIIELKQAKKADKKLATVKNARKQAFEGLILAVKHGSEPGAMFTVRKVASGVGVEKVFPLYSPMIDSIELLRRASTRRAKLYFIRDKASRDQKRAMRKSVVVSTQPKAVPEEEEVLPAPIVEEVASAPEVEVVPAEVSEEAAS
jgi:large subunit ribosomal protein L19